VRHIGHNASTASTSKAGRFATLGGLPRIQGSGASSQRCALAVLSLLATTLGALLFSATPALAGGVHVYTSSFGSATSTVTNPEPLSDPTGIAINEKTNEIDVIDTGHNRIERFSTKGAYEGQFNGSETLAKEFSNPNAITVDNDPTSPSYGDIYVSDEGHGVIDKFEPNGKYLNQITGTPEGPFQNKLEGIAVQPPGSLSPGTLWVYEAAANETVANYLQFNDAIINKFVVRNEVGGLLLAGIAAGSGGNLYAVMAFSKVLFEYTPPEGFNFFDGFEGGHGTGVGFDPSTNKAYADQGTTVAIYPPDPTGPTPEEEFGTGHLTGGVGIAVSASGTAYVADATVGDVVVFEEAPKPETPLTNETVTLEGLAATVKGELRGGESTYYFAYNTNGTCTGTGTLKTPLTAATGTTTVSAKIAGLVAKTTYTFCLIAENQYGQTSGAAESFETKPSAPVIEEAGASVKEAGVTLHASINPELEPSTCTFQYGKTEAYEHQAPCQALGEGGKSVAVSAAVAGLEPDTTYDYRILANNKTGEQHASGTFTTEVITPTPVETAQATNVTSTSAMIGGQVNPQGGATYYIEYGSPTCSLNGISNFVWWLCASKSSEAGPLTGDTAQSVAPIEITGLTPGTTYSYWIVAHNINGSERGEEMKFTTPAALAPAVVGPSPALTPAPIVAPAHAPVKPPVKKKKTAAQEKAEKLSKALKQCKKLTSKAKRKACEAQAHNRYVVNTNAKGKKHAGGKRHG
jgi:hypothetical protein